MKTLIITIAICISMYAAVGWAKSTGETLAQKHQIAYQSK